MKLGLSPGGEVTVEGGGRVREKVKLHFSSTLIFQVSTISSVLASSCLNDQITITQ